MCLIDGEAQEGGRGRGREEQKERPRTARPTEGMQGADSDDGKREGEEDPDERREAKRPKREGKQIDGVIHTEPTVQEFAWKEDTLPVELVKAILEYATHDEDSYMYTVLSFVRRQWHDILPGRPDGYFVVDAIGEGCLSVVQWAVGQGCPLEDIPCDMGMCEAAAINGDVEALKWLSERGVTFDAQELSRTAAEFGSVEVLKWLSERTDPFDAHYLGIIAAQCGKVGVLEWMMEAGHPVHEAACLEAVNHERWGVVECLVRAAPVKNAERGGKICYKLALHRRLDLLRMVSAKGYPVDDTAPCEKAARRNDLETLKCLRACGFDWNGSVCIHAISIGNLGMFKWAVRNGCPCDMQRCARAMSLQMRVNLLQESVASPTPSHSA